MTSLTDYSNTVIYKISCRDPTVSGVYVGHTVDFIKRKYAHQKSSEDNKCTNLLYRTIRMHGGWDNWEMKMVGFFHCNNLTEAREKEQEFFISLNASLNSVEPMPNRVVREKVNKPVVAVNENVEEVVAVNEPVAAVNENIEETVVMEHVVAVNEKVEETVVNEPAILADGRFSCEACEYVCQLKQHYKQHCTTKKHIIKIKQHATQDIKCSKCNKQYKNRSGLWKHAKHCVRPQTDYVDVIKQLVVCNNELRGFVLENLNENKKSLLELKNLYMEQKATLIEQKRNTK